MGQFELDNHIIGIKGAGEMATGISVCLKRAGFSRIFMMEIEHPLAVRRTVSFCEAVHDEKSIVEGIEAVKTKDMDDIFRAWERGKIAVMVDPNWAILPRIQPAVIIDAIIAKKNLGTTLRDGSLVIGLGPGFTAGEDVDKVIETMRGHYLGRIIDKGSALANTGIPGSIDGHSMSRVLRSPVTGIFHPERNITDKVRIGDIIGVVEQVEISANIDGIIRGLTRQGTLVNKGIKIADIDPRGHEKYCFTVSDKSRAIGRAVLETILASASCKVNSPVQQYK